MSVTDKHVKSLILSQFQEVAREQNKQIVSLSDDQALLDLGLDSLCLAVVVARLEDLLGLDPFSTTDDVYFPATVGDFIQCYETAALKRGS